MDDFPVFQCDFKTAKGTRCARSARWKFQGVNACAMHYHANKDRERQGFKPLPRFTSDTATEPKRG